MKKTINVILLLILSLILLTTTVLGENIAVIMVSSPTWVKPGDTFTVSINLSNSDGLNSGKGTITYSSDVVSLESIAAGDQSAWSQPSKEDSGNGQANFTIARSSTDVNGNEIIILTFKVKENATAGETVISISDFTVSNSNYEDVNIPEATTTITITNASSGNNGSTGNGSNNGSTGNSGNSGSNGQSGGAGTGSTQKPNSSTNKNNTANKSTSQSKNTAKGTLPQTGIGVLLPMLGLAAVIIGIGTYVSYRKYKNM